MKNSIVILILFLAPIIVFGQNDSKKNVVPKRNTVYLEAYGQGLYNSLSFDRLSRANKRVKSSVTIGLTLVPTLRSNKFLAIGVPVSYNLILGKRKSHLELGLGLTYLNETRLDRFYERSSVVGGGCIIPPDAKSFMVMVTRNYIYLTPKISYRFQNPTGGLFFRVSVTPPIALINMASPVKNGDEVYSERTFTYFPKTRRTFNGADPKLLPWLGFSLGYTIK